MNCMLGFILLASLLLPQENIYYADDILYIKISEQKMYHITDNKLKKIYDISSSQYGIGNQKGSNQTPLGLHRVIEKIGADEEIGTIFKYRAPKNVIEVDPNNTDNINDHITSRIIRLIGMETDKNFNGNVDSYERCIYIHGTAVEGLIGTPSSNGCIRMRNSEVIELFNEIDKNTQVIIVE